MEELPATTELEEGLRNGVFLAKLAHFMAPTVVPIRFDFVYKQHQSRFPTFLRKFPGKYLTLTNLAGGVVASTSSTQTTSFTL